MFSDRNISEKDPFLQKLNTAMYYAIDATILGSDNRIGDIEHTNGASVIQKFRILHYFPQDIDLLMLFCMKKTVRKVLFLM